MMSPAMTLCRANKHYVTISPAEQDHISSDSRVTTGEAWVANQWVSHLLQPSILTGRLHMIPQHQFLGIRIQVHLLVHPVGNWMAVVANPSYLDFGQFCRTLYIRLISTEKLA